MNKLLRICIATHASRECAELFSPFSSFGDDWQSSSVAVINLGVQQPQRRAGPAGMLMAASAFRLEPGSM